MIPIKDTIPSKTFPFATIFLIVINFAFFFHEIFLEYNLMQFIRIYGVIPRKYYLFGIYKFNFLSMIIPLLTSIFLHAGWMHIFGNMLYLWIFGDNVEDKLGHFRFLIFYILSGIFATFVQIYINPFSTTPIIGASGAIAGVLGAYFIFFPKSRIVTLVPIFFFIRIIELPALVFLGFWFLIQFFSGTLLSSQSLNINEGGIAWWAHIGGFIFGVGYGFYKKNKGK